MKPQRLYPRAHVRSKNGFISPCGVGIQQLVLAKNPDLNLRCAPDSDQLQILLRGVSGRRCPKRQDAPRCALQSLVLWPKRLKPKCQIGIVLAPALAPALACSTSRGAARTYQELGGAWWNGFDRSIPLRFDCFQITRILNGMPQL